MRHLMVTYSQMQQCFKEKGESEKAQPVCILQDLALVSVEKAMSKGRTLDAKGVVRYSKAFLTPHLGCGVVSIPPLFVSILNRT